MASVGQSHEVSFRGRFLATTCGGSPRGVATIATPVEAARIDAGLAWSALMTLFSPMAVTFEFRVLELLPKSRNLRSQ